MPVALTQVSLEPREALLTPDGGAEAAPVVGIASNDSHKGEDTSAILEGQRVSGYAVFDGHGGFGCSKACAEPEVGMLARLLTGVSKLPTPTQIEDVFWRLDAEVGAELAAIGGHGRDQGGAHAGTTACVLLVEQLGSGSSVGGMACTLAWVGDSTAIAVDMTAADAPPLAWATSNHSACDAAEAARLGQLVAMSRVLLPDEPDGDSKARKKAAKMAKRQADLKALEQRRAALLGQLETVSSQLGELSGREGEAAGDAGAGGGDGLADGDGAGGASAQGRATEQAAAGEERLSAGEKEAARESAGDAAAAGMGDAVGGEAEWNEEAAPRLTTAGTPGAGPSREEVAAALEQVGLSPTEGVA